MTGSHTTTRADHLDNVRAVTELYRRGRGISEIACETGREPDDVRDLLAEGLIDYLMAPADIRLYRARQLANVEAENTRLADLSDRVIRALEAEASGEEPVVNPEVLLKITDRRVKLWEHSAKLTGIEAATRIDTRMEQVRADGHLLELIDQAHREVAAAEEAIAAETENP